ncbi:hypothetical protein PYCCODRAFT_1216443 [Trametes coccinea BRFM310]|uniref:Uncharacterized protein n=1 Tax=Trametes coccinea (strain BRFM310) TaxID=1353009 RepID=A0A1Y2IA97_TRAC3|nr:hypothetical protein PYCCODRAFT_1216443 [Trametes coccinea BRFM310]
MMMRADGGRALQVRVRTGMYGMRATSGQDIQIYTCKSSQSVSTVHSLFETRGNEKKGTHSRGTRLQPQPQRLDSHHRRHVQGIRAHPVRLGKIGGCCLPVQHARGRVRRMMSRRQGMRVVCGMRRMGTVCCRARRGVKRAMPLRRMASVMRRPRRLRMRPIRVAVVVAVGVGGGSVVVAGSAAGVREILHVRLRVGTARKRPPIPLREAAHVLLLRIPPLALRRLLAVLLSGLSLLQTLAKLLLLLSMELERIVLRLRRQVRVLRQLLPEGD